MSDKPESFLERWSRLKLEPKQAPAETGRPDDEPPLLPPIEELNAESDYSAFMHPKVDPGLRRAALRKLFSSERFRSTDGLDVYVGDYSNPQPLAAGMVALLRHAEGVLGRGEKKVPTEAAQDGAHAASGADAERAPSDAPSPDPDKKGPAAA
jgi:hypothetical protein